MTIDTTIGGYGKYHYRHILCFEFARCGFLSCPLTDDEIETLRLAGAGPYDAYMVGCDVAAGFSFDEAREGIPGIDTDAED